MTVPVIALASSEAMKAAVFASPGAQAHGADVPRPELGRQGAGQRLDCCPGRCHATGQGAASRAGPSATSTTISGASSVRLLGRLRVPTPVVRAAPDDAHYACAV